MKAAMKVTKHERLARIFYGVASIILLAMAILWRMFLLNVDTGVSMARALFVLVVAALLCGVIAAGAFSGRR
jgi:hypothetical protein